MDLLVMALATASITVTLSKAKVFEPLRSWLLGREVHHSHPGGETARTQESRSGPLGWIGRMLQCSYCTSHWVASAVATCTERAFHPLHIMAVVTLAAPASWLAYKAHEGMAKKQ